MTDEDVEEQIEDEKYTKCAICLKDIVEADQGIDVTMSLDQIEEWQDYDTRSGATSDCGKFYHRKCLVQALADHIDNHHGPAISTSALIEAFLPFFGHPPFVPPKKDDVDLLGWCVGNANLTYLFEVAEKTAREIDLPGIKAAGMTEGHDDAWLIHNFRNLRFIAWHCYFFSNHHFQREIIKDGVRTLHPPSFEPLPTGLVVVPSIFFAEPCPGNPRAIPFVSFRPLAEIAKNPTFIAGPKETWFVYAPLVVPKEVIER